MTKVLIIGAFGKKNQPIDGGQTIRTNLFYEELIKRTNWKIKKVNTSYKLLSIIKILFFLPVYKKVIFMVAKNGIRVLLPLLSWYKKLFRIEIYHNGIGGNLHQHIKERPSYTKYLNSFEVNWFQYKEGIKELENMGVNNMSYLPNFKKFEILSSKDIKHIQKNGVIRLCIFSRISEDKGVKDAIETVISLNNLHTTNTFTLDIYGKVQQDFKEIFFKLLEQSPDLIKYCGVAPYDDATRILNNYDCLLFPTRYIGEGFPGTVVDAFSAGLPVIATDWYANAEIIENEKTGFIYPNNKTKTLGETILYFASLGDEKIYEMKISALNESRKYHTDLNIDTIIKKVENL